MEYKLKEAIEKKRIAMLRDLKKHHGDMIKRVEGPSDIEELEHWLDRAELEDWEDVAWYQGFLAALRWVKFDAITK